jgi:cysteine desulfurase
MNAPIYLDHQATTPCDPAVVAAMQPWWAEQFGNAASRSHRAGLVARQATETARRQVAQLLGASPKEIVFTSGATEANNLAILGTVRASDRKVPHVITVATEHQAVLDPCEALVRRGEAEVTVLPVDGQGLVDPDALRAALRPHTVLVSVMAVNNEIGVEQPLAELGAICEEAGVRLHTDAAQAAYTPLDPAAIGAQLVSLSAHKLYGPKGVGALYVRRGRPKTTLEPLLYGGGHERGLRSGTLPVPLLVGFGEAAAQLLAHRDEERARLAGLQQRLWIGLSEGLTGVHLHGHPTQRAPHNLNVRFDGVEAEALLLALRDTVALSTGSACSSEVLKPSHVLEALGLPAEELSASLRFGLGRPTTEAQIDTVVAAVVAKVTELRAMASLYTV